MPPSLENTFVSIAQQLTSFLTEQAFLPFSFNAKQPNKTEMAISFRQIRQEEEIL